MTASGQLEKVRVGLLVYPEVNALDVIGPAEIFAGSSHVDVHLVGKTITPVRTSGGWRIVPTTSFADTPELDVLCVPGGVGQIALMTDEKTLGFVRRQAATARYVTSVCTGALLLGAAGLLRGYRATTHWMSHDQLALFGAVPQRQRVVVDRNRITGAGVTAGMDFALVVLGELFGEQEAQAVQLAVEYDPAPPYTAGQPHLASADVVAQVTARAVAKQDSRLETSRAAVLRLRDL
ncbi:MAG TPA: DJ-1/PfpI family protein [Amycolatopsis sp.]|nr:DJ-1/PfpI family protein [Amycolatopsis sp.]